MTAVVLVAALGLSSPAVAQPSPDQQDAVTASAETQSRPALPFDREGLVPADELRAVDRVVRPYCGSDAFSDEVDGSGGPDIVGYELDYDCEADLLVASVELDSAIDASQIARFELWMDSDLDPTTGCGGADHLALLRWQPELADFAGGTFAVSACEGDAQLVAPVGYVRGEQSSPRVGLLLQGSYLTDDRSATAPGPPERMRWFQVLVSQDGSTDRAPDRGWSVFDLPEGADRIVVGDWNGDGVDTLGVVRGETVLLTNLNEPGLPDVSFRYGGIGAARFVGDWNGDGIDAMAYRVGNLFRMRDTNSSGPPDDEVGFGRPGDEVFTGDWDGDGLDTFGVRRQNTMYLDNDGQSGPAEVEAAFGRAADEFFVGDWDGDGLDTFAVRRGNQLFLTNSIDNPLAEQVVTIGGAADGLLVGDWDGDGLDTFGIRRGNEFRLSDDLAFTDERVFTFGR